MKEIENKYLTRPLECSIFELDKFYELVIKSGKVEKKVLKDRILKCEFLAFYTVNEIIVAVSAIKKPDENYLVKLIKKAKLARNVKDLRFEIGYSFTDENFRKKGYSSSLKTLLISELKGFDGILFSTAATPTSQKFLISNGFSNVGIPFDGKYDNNIMYYEFNLNDNNRQTL